MNKETSSKFEHRGELCFAKAATQEEKKKNSTHEIQKKYPRSEVIDPGSGKLNGDSLER